MSDEIHIAAIDLGTSETKLGIARIDGDNIRIIHYDSAPSEGISQGTITNNLKTSRTVQGLLSRAEEEIGQKITQVVVNLPRYNITAGEISERAERNPDNNITEDDILCLRNLAKDNFKISDEENCEVYDIVPISYGDGVEIQIPQDEIIGMCSSCLIGNYKIFSGKKKGCREIDLAFNKVSVSAIRKYFIPVSTAEAVLTAEEMEKGVVLVDIGAGVTGISIFFGGVLRYYACIPFGGKTISDDIMNECDIPFTLAENIKKGFGYCLPQKLLTLEEKALNIDNGPEEPATQIPMKFLSEVITARMKEIIDAVLYYVQESGFADMIKGGIVLTGGGAKLKNSCTMFQEMSGWKVRTGYPLRKFSVDGPGDCPDEGAHDCSAATVIGMILTARNEYNIDCTVPEEPAYTGARLDPDEPAANSDDVFQNLDETSKGDIAIENPGTDAEPLKPRTYKEPSAPKKKVKEVFSGIGGLFRDTLFGNENDDETV